MATNPGSFGIGSREPYYLCHPDKLEKIDALMREAGRQNAENQAKAAESAIRSVYNVPIFTSEYLKSGEWFAVSKQVEAKRDDDLCRTNIRLRPYNLGFSISDELAMEAGLIKPEKENDVNMVYDYLVVAVDEEDGEILSIYDSGMVIAKSAENAKLIVANKLDSGKLEGREILVRSFHSH